MDRRAALLVHERDGRAVGRRRPPIAPGQQGGDDGIEVVALGGEAVLEPFRVVVVLHPIEHALGDEVAQSFRHDRPAGAGVALEVIETAGPEERLAHEQHRPAITHHRQRPRHGAARIADVVPTHESPYQVAFKF